MAKELDTQVALHETVILSLDDVGLCGELDIPEKATSVILLLGGSGSIRPCEVTRFVARELNKFGHATLVFDLLTAEEESDDEAQECKHTEFLAHRIVEASKWLQMNGDTEKLPLGYFCTANGGEAAFVAAGHLQQKVGAIVSSGAYIDLTVSQLKKLQSPTLFIARENEISELLRTRAIAERLTCEHHVEVIPLSCTANGDDCAKSRVAELTREWFSWYLSKR